jgi:hypothetical protein
VAQDGSRPSEDERTGTPPPPPPSDAGPPPPPPPPPAASPPDVAAAAPSPWVPPSVGSEPSSAGSGWPVEQGADRRQQPPVEPQPGTSAQSPYGYPTPGTQPPGSSAQTPPGTQPPGSGGPPPGWGGQPPSSGTQPPGWGAQPPRIGHAGHLIRLQPMTVADVLDGAFRMFRSTFARSALLVLVILGPYQLLSSLVLTRLVPEIFGPEAFLDVTDPAELDLAGILGSLGGWGVALQVIGLLVNVIVGAAVVALVLQADRGEGQDVGAALRTGLARSGATVGGSVLVLLLVVAGVVALVPVVVVLVVIPVLGWIALIALIPLVVGLMTGLFSLVVPVAVVEDRGAWTTFRRALWVVRARFWRVIGITLLVLLVLGVVSAIVALPLGLVSIVAGSFGWVVDGISSTAVSVLTLPVTAYAALLVYLDARVRREGLDLEVRTRGLLGG